MLLDGKKCLSWMAHGCEEVAALIANLILMLSRKSGMDGRPSSGWREGSAGTESSVSRI